MNETIRISEKNGRVIVKNYAPVLVLWNRYYRDYKIDHTVLAVVDFGMVILKSKSSAYA